MLSRLAVAAILSTVVSMPAASQGSSVYDYPGEYAGRFDGAKQKGGAGASETVTIGGARRLAAGSRVKARKPGGAGSPAPAAKGRQGYWDYPSFQGGTRVGTQGAKGRRKLQAK
jgi:hypothetical protein